MNPIVEQGIDGLREALAEMVQATRAMIDRAVAAIEGDRDGVQPDVHAMDERLNQYELKLDHMCEVLLLLREPYAVDFRYIFTTIKVTRDLERIGDEVKVIARWVRKLDGAASEPIREMAHAAKRAVERATDSLLNRDVQGAERVLAGDEKINALEVSVLTTTESVPEAFIAHAWERIGDRATNIAEGVIYVVRAQDVRHQKGGA